MIRSACPLTGSPLEEIKSAKLILKTLGLRRGGVEVVSCPTCGRTQIDLIGLANQVETLVQGYPLDIKVAVMGCVVNGPGEAKEADLGVAGGIGEGLLIRKGEIVKNCRRVNPLPALKAELDRMVEEKKQRNDRMKTFLEVFPDLHIAENVRGLLEMVGIEKISTNRDRSVIRVYIDSPRLDAQAEYLRSGKRHQGAVISGQTCDDQDFEKYHLSSQYTPEKLMNVYRDSILMELKNYSILLYNMFRKAEMDFEEEGYLKLSLEDTMIVRDKAPELVRILEKIFTERCNVPVVVKTSLPSG